MTQPTHNPPGGGSWLWDDEAQEWLELTPAPDLEPAPAPAPVTPATAPATDLAPE